MEPERVPKSFCCFAPKGLRLRLPRRPRSNSIANSSSPIITNTKTSGREDELRQVFRRFDGDNDGKISALELRAYFASVGEYMSHEEAQGVIDDLDSDGDNLLDVGDFLGLMKRDVDDEVEDLKSAFEMFELEGTGRITPRSLQRVLSRLGDSTSYDECAAMIRVFDSDGNGDLDFHEFHKMMA